MFLKKGCRENQNSRSVFSTFFFPKYRPFYEIMWKNMVEPEKPQKTT